MTVNQLYRTSLTATAECDFYDTTMFFRMRIISNSINAISEGLITISMIIYAENTNTLVPLYRLLGPIRQKTKRLF
jgi:hypothetical protein